MKLIDVDSMELSYSGLVYIDPTDTRETALYFVRQVRSQPEVKAIPIDFINELIREPENAGAKSRVLSWLKKKWEEENDRN